MQTLLIGRLQNPAHSIALFSGVKLLLDVLRGPVLTHTARRGLSIRELDHEVVPSDWLVYSCRINSHLCCGQSIHS